MRSRNLLFTLTMFVCCFYLQAQEWKLELDKNEIQVYSKDLGDSDYNDFKALATADVPYSAIVAQLQDVETHPEVFNTISEASLTYNPSRFNYTILSQLDLPWPMTDRTMLLENLVTHSDDKKIITINMKCLDANEYAAEDKILVDDCSGKWILESLGENQTKVYYQFHLDLGGNAPSKIVNMKSPSEHMKTIQSVIARSANEKYRSFVLE